jgi:hypothetical protein
LTESLCAWQHRHIESSLASFDPKHYFTLHLDTCLFRPNPSLHDTGSLGGPRATVRVDLACWARRPKLPSGLLRPRFHWVCRAQVQIQLEVLK